MTLEFIAAVAASVLSGIVLFAIKSVASSIRRDRNMSGPWFRLSDDYASNDLHRY